MRRMLRARARLLVIPLALLAACSSETVGPKPPNRVCSAGDVKPCYSGPAGTEGLGVCRAGTRACLADGSDFAETCDGEITPSPEDCATPEDDDCNGLANDACACAPGE